MHRSGTSALTNVLALAGAELPAQLMQPNSANVRGFFESEAIYQLHEEMLESLGSSWHDLSPLPAGWESSALANQFKERFLEIVKEQYQASPLFVLKDPRICRLVPFWLEVLDRLGVDVDFVLTVRNPLEVSASLSKASQIDELRGRALWLQHFLLAEHDTRDSRRVFVTYDQLLEDWRTALRRIGEGLEINFPRRSRKAESEIDAFIDGQLRNHETSPRAADERSDVSKWVRETYQWARKAAEGRAPNSKIMDRIAKKFMAAEALFGPIVAESDRRFQKATHTPDSGEDRSEFGFTRIDSGEDPQANPQIDVLSDSVQKMLLLWATDMHDRGSLTGDQLEQIVSSIQGESGWSTSSRDLLDLIAEVESSSRGVESGRVHDPIQIRAVSSIGDASIRPEEQLNRLQIQLQYEQEDRKRGQVRENKQEEELEGLRSKLSDFKTWQHRAQIAELALRNHRTEMNELRDQLHRNEREWSELHKNLEASKSQAESRMIREVAEVSDEVDQLKEALSDQRDTLEAQSSELEAARQFESVVEAQQLELRQNRAAIQEVSQLREGVIEREKKIEGLIAEKDAQARSNSEMYLDLERHAEHLTETNSALRHQIESAKVEYASKEATQHEAYGALKMRAAEFEESKTALQGELESAQAEYASKEAAHASEKESASRAHAQAYGGLQSRLANSERSNTALQGELESAQAEYAEKEVAHASEKESASRAHAQAYGDLQARLANSERSNTALQGELESAQAEYAEKEAVHVSAAEAAESTSKDLRQKITSLEASQANLQRDLDQHQLQQARIESENKIQEARRTDPRMPGGFCQGPRAALSAKNRIWAQGRRPLKLAYWTLTLQLRHQLRQRRIGRRLRASGLFDDAYYLAHSPESISEIGDPAMHYVRHGAAEGRNPNAAFDTTFYLSRHSDVQESGANPLDHFAQHGWQENRRPHAYFDPDFYLASNPDIALTGENPLLHWLREGWKAGRLSAPPAAYADLVEQWLSPSQPGSSPTSYEPDPHPLPQELEPSHPIEPTLHPTPVRLRAKKLSEWMKSGVRRNLKFSYRPLSVDLQRKTHSDDPIVFVVTHELPSPPTAGNRYRILRYVQWLEKRGAQVVVIYCPLDRESPDPSSLENAVQDFENLICCGRSGQVVSIVSPHLESILSELDGLEIGELIVEKPYEGESQEEFDQRIHTEKTFCPDALVELVLFLDRRLQPGTYVIANYVWSSRYLPLLREETRTLIDTHDQFSSKQEKVGQFGLPPDLALTEIQERGMLLRANVIMAIQPEEADAFRSLVPERHVLTVGVDFDLPDEKAASAMHSDAAGPTVLGLVGSSNQMNIKGAQDFLRYVWPLLRRENDQQWLIVAGSLCEGLPRGLPGVELLGPLDSLESFYQRCDVLINPTIAGTGLKIKTVEAIANGKPIVCWPLGVEGISLPLRKFCHVAEDWYQFYLLIAGLLEGDQKSSSFAPTREILKAHLSSDVIYAPLGEDVDLHHRTDSSQ